MSVSPSTSPDSSAPKARVVLITGAAKRIGRGLALGFAARGWDVAVHFGGSEGEAQEVVQSIRALGRRAVALHADLCLASGLAPGLTLPCGDMTSAEFEAAHKVTPLGRASRVDDVVAAACYLADASGVTGTTLVVDGGQHLVPSPRDIMFLTAGRVPGGGV